MGVQKRTRKFATVKRIIGQRDARLKKNIAKSEEQSQKKKKGDDLIREVYVTTTHLLFSPNTNIHNSPQVPSSMFFVRILIGRTLHMSETVTDPAN